MFASSTRSKPSASLPCREGVSAKEHHDVVIHANELTFEQGISTGDIIRYFVHALSSSAQLAAFLKQLVVVQQAMI